MDELLSTRQVGWLLDRSPGSIRRMIVDGEIDGTRIPGGYRIPKAEAIRLSRVGLETEAGRSLTDRQLERLIDTVIATNEART